MERAKELQLEPVVRRRAYQDVIEKIKNEILEGRLQSGDRLPGERRLSEMLGISRAPVREALRVLETLDIIRARRGTGPESGSIVVGEVGNAMADTLLMHTALDHVSLSEMVEVRVVLEGLAVDQAAKHADEAALARLQEFVDRMNDPEVTPEEFFRIDSGFHMAIAQVSGNRLNSYLMQSIRSIVEHTLQKIFVSSPDWPRTRAEVAAEHEAIMSAIRNGDGATGSAMITEHILKSFERFHPT